MKLPSLIRAAGVLRIKVALANTLGTPPKDMRAPTPKMPAPVNPMANLAQQNSQQAQADTALKGPETLFSPKLSSFEDLAKFIPTVGEDAATFMLRRAAKGGQTALKAPIAVQKVQQINDPTYEPNPNYKRLSRALGLIEKMSTAGASAAPPDASQEDNHEAQQQPYAWSKLPFGERFPDREVKNLFDVNGPAFRNALPNSSDSVALNNNPKIAGAGNVQEENRGGYQDNTKLMPGHSSDLLAGGARTEPNAVNDAFDRLRAFLKQDNNTMNTVGQDACAGPAG